MINKKGFVVVNWILLGLIFVIIVFGIWYLYLNLPGEAENLEAVIVEAPAVEPVLLEGVSQFYPNMKFNHNAISYKIDPDCSNEKTNRMLSAFDELASKVELISFYESFNGVDIEVTCSDYKKQAVDKDHFIAGEGGAKEIVQTGRFNVISNGTVILHGDAKGFVKCDWPNVEIHELTHVFGFGHSENPDSLMYAYLKDCSQELDQPIINELKRLYSDLNLADLYFDKVSAVKKGRYLDFNLTIKNSGSIRSEKTQFSVLDNGKLIESFDLDAINYGAGISIEIKNLKLGSRSSEELRFVIDRKDLVDELYEENNIATVSLGE